MVRLLVFIVGLIGLSAASEAQVEEPRDFPVERFRLSTTLLGINDVESSSSLPHKSWSLGLMGMYVDSPLSLYDVNTKERRGELIESRIAASLVGHFALFDRFEIGLEIPLILNQSRDTMAAGVALGQSLEELQSFGIRDIRIAPKVSLFKGTDRLFNASLILGVTIPAGGNTEYLGEDGVSFVPELAIGGRFGKIRYLANVAYRMRKNVEFLDLQIEDELVGRAGVAVGFGEKTPIEVGASITTATSASEGFDKFNQNYLEGILGANATINDKWTPFAGFGFGITNGFGTPDWRAFLGVRYTNGAGNDPDGDGILGDDDQCPNDPEDKDNFEDQNGCPDLDNDKDGIPDKKDGAPNDPEDKDDFEDEDGVPDPDNDKDGILDGDDKCPNEPETKNDFEDSDGCPDVPDTDGDGIADDKDECKEQPEDKDGFEDENGCPDPDNDQDGVTDAKDGCPNKPGPVPNSGCPDTDRDGDTVVDRLDNCPDEKGSPKFQGCKKKQLVKITDEKLEILQIVYFANNKAKIRARSFRLLRNVAQVLKNQKRIKLVEIEGHTDDRGDDAYNKDLSQRRAKAVVDFLVSEGVDPARLKPIGYGEEKPVKSNRNSKGRAANRRVEFTIKSIERATKD